MKAYFRDLKSVSLSYRCLTIYLRLQNNFYLIFIMNNKTDSIIIFESRICLLLDWFQVNVLSLLLGGDIVCVLHKPKNLRCALIVYISIQRNRSVSIL